MSQVFISYSHKDKDFVQYLVYRLWERDVPFWIDEHQINGGERWRDSINSALNTSDVMILVITPDSMNSLEVSREWEYFLNKKKPIIPIILKKVDLQYQLGDIQHIEDFTKVSGFDNGFLKLTQSLSSNNIVFDSHSGWIDYGIQSLEENPQPFHIFTQDFVSSIRRLNHSIRVCFPIRFNLPSEFAGYRTHIQSLRELIGTRIWFQNDLLHEVSSNLYYIESILSNHRLPYFMKRFLDAYQQLLLSRWIKVAYFDNPEHPYIVETLPCDETLLNELLDSAREFSEEFDQRINKIRLPPPILGEILSELSNANIRVHGLAPVNVPNSEMHQQPHSYCRVHCGFVRLDWIDMPTLEEQGLAETIIEKVLIERYWFLSNFPVTIISL